MKMARKAIIEYLNGRKISPPENTPSKLRRYAGVFVTLENYNKPLYERLRGCIGYPRPIMPLINATINAAIQAAFFDPRFKPLKESELGRVVIEISVLSNPKLLKVEKRKNLPRMIKIGRDGLIIEHGPFSGLLLPQVPVEYKWDSEVFLMEACMKAGLPPDAWLDEETKVYVFQAVIFTEVKPNGDVVLRDLEKELNEAD